MRKLISQKHGAVAMELGLLVGLMIAIILGVMVFYQANSALFYATPSGTTLAARNASWATLNQTAQTSFTLMPVIAIVVIAGIVLGIILLFGVGKPPI